MITWFFIMPRLAHLTLPPPPPQPTGPFWTSSSSSSSSAIVAVTTPHRNGPQCLQDLDVGRAVLPARPVLVRIPFTGLNQSPS